MKKNKFTQHVPAFVDMSNPQSFYFDSTQELIENDYLKKFSNRPNFNHFALSRNVILAIFDDGFRWIGLGFVDNPENVELPPWEGWKFRAILDGEEVVLGKEVTCSQGNRLTLRDGRTAYKLPKRPAHP